MDKGKTILIVDDVEINRIILTEIFNDNYCIIEAGSGAEAIGLINSNPDIVAVLLDLLMPGVSGLGVLEDMNRTGKIKHIPVFLITAAESDAVLMEGYHLGAVDVIRKPFMAQFLRCRVGNLIELYAHRNALEGIVEEQVAKLQAVNQSMVETLAAIIEFRDCESGEHVKRIGRLTRIMLTEVSSTYPEYYLPKKEIDTIVTASVLHDIGKISIPDQILNKPGRLTAEEFDTMKLHTVKGCEILQGIPDIMDADIYSYSYDICRHHHERWDGKGYPDGLKGDEISIWAQVVAIADVYDALTAERVYKAAYSREKAVDMIYNGECGTFNPKLLEVFRKALRQLENDI